MCSHFICASVSLLLFCEVCMRPALARVDPVDCVLSEWTQWTRCDPCLKRRYRYAKLLQPSQFGGEPCSSQGREEEVCVPPAGARCAGLPRCEGFLCVTTGRCVPEGLRCNGDDDCGDGSDEKGCRKVSRACRQPTEEYWGIENLAKGINVLSGRLEGVVLDHRYYAGSCLPHFIQDVRFRKPYNLQQYTLETKGSYDFKMESYESYSEFYENTMSASKSETSVSFGLKLPGVFELSFDYSDSKYQKSVKKMRRYTQSGYSFVRAHSQLELARYSLKTEGLVLHGEFLLRLRSLPEEYVYGEYRQLFRDFGTHYITEATLGGDYDYVLILNKERLEKSGYTLTDYKNCVQIGLKVGVNIEGVYVSAGVSGGGCNGLLNEMGEDTVKGSVVEDFVAVVKGGNSESVARLVAKKLPTPELMQLWGEGVHFNPDFIRTKMEPLFELVTPRDFSNGYTLKGNLKRALEEYLAESSSCRCVPCSNNGLAVLKGTRCDCVCPNGYSGRGCEITQRSGTVVQGSWSCWSSWSTCSGRSQRRTRQCNNPSPSQGGVACSGISEESTNCT